MPNFLPIVSSIPAIPDSIIKVIGVGGGGGNAVNHMYNQGYRDVSFVVCNTDNQALKSSPVPLKIQLGEGLGAGGIPEVAREAAEESIDSIKKVLEDNTKMIFITAGMGGGTGTGASPVVARTAREMDILTVGIVTIPFAFEGKRKIHQALAGVHALSEHVDALLVINNEKLKEIYPDLELSNAFAKADDVLTNAARSIAEIITETGYINTDFADVNTILKNGNVAIMNTGFASGENRITKAIDDALTSPLLNTTDVKGASKVLLNLYCSKEHQIKMEEVQQINDFMATIGEDIQVIWGATYDDSLGEEVKITLIATGYEVSDIPGMAAAVPKKTEEATTVDLDGNEEVSSEEVEEKVEKTEEEKIKESIEFYYGDTEEKKEEESSTETTITFDFPEEDEIKTNTDQEKEVSLEEEIEKEEIPIIDLDNMEDEDVVEQAADTPSFLKNLKDKTKDGLSNFFLM